MDAGFITTIQTLVTEQGKEVLLNTKKAKSLLADYAKNENEYKKDTNWLRQMLDADCAKIINDAQDVPKVKRALVKRLEDDIGLTSKVTAEILDLLGLVLRGDKSVTVGAVTPTPSLSLAPKPAVPTPIAAQPANPWHKEKKAGKHKKPDKFKIPDRKIIICVIGVGIGILITIVDHPMEENVLLSYLGFAVIGGSICGVFGSTDDGGVLGSIGGSILGIIVGIMGGFAGAHYIGGAVASIIGSIIGGIICGIIISRSW
jgi:hypothetical protein